MNRVTGPMLSQQISLAGRRRKNSGAIVPEQWKPIIAELNEYVAAGAGKNRQAVLCMGVDRGDDGAAILCRHNAERNSEFCQAHDKRSKR